MGPAFRTSALVSGAPANRSQDLVYARQSKVALATGSTDWACWILPSVSANHLWNTTLGLREAPPEALVDVPTHQIFERTHGHASGNAAQTPQGTQTPCSPMSLLKDLSIPEQDIKIGYPREPSEADKAARLAGERQPDVDPKLAPSILTTKCSAADVEMGLQVHGRHRRRDEPCRIVIWR